MRRTALALLVASSGCNWVFGLNPTVASNPDGGDSEKAPDPIHTRLVWGMPKLMNGAPIGVDYKAIGAETTRPMLPMVFVGKPLDSGEPLEMAQYAIADGSFEIPFMLRETPHRIVYTLPGETVAHEVQWSVSGATLVVPRTSRFDAAVVPTGSGYEFTPMSVGAHPSSPMLMTTGVFTYDDNIDNFVFPMPPASAVTTQYDFATMARPLAGPAGAPQLSLGDFVLLADLGANTAGERNVTGFAIAQVDLSASTLAQPAPQPTWISSGASRTLKTLSCGTDCIPQASSTGVGPRFNSVLHGSTNTELLTYGMSPSTELPGFLPGVPPTYTPRPDILTFATMSPFPSQLSLVDPSLALDASNNPLLKFDRVAVAGVTSPRTVDGATLTTSLQTITKTLSGAVTFDAPLAHGIKLDMADLSAADGVMIDPSSQATPLKWTVETNYTASDFVVTLFEITGGNLAPVRIYQVLSPQVAVDGSLLQPGREYTFSITARKGFTNAVGGDYQAVTYPFHEATTFSAAFTVKP